MIMRKHIRFQAAAVSVEKNEDVGYYSVGFTGGDKNVPQYIFINRSFSCDVHGSELCTDTEYVEVNDQGFSGYQSCQFAALSSKKLTVALAINSEDWLVEVDISAVTITDTAVEYLRRILSDKLQIDNAV